MNLRATLINRWDIVRNSYWFLPTLMATASVLLSLGTLRFDAIMAGESLGDAWWVYTGSATGARAVLQTIGTSMIGVAGVVFSITTVTLTLAANKFGPRIFRNFMSDTGNQIVLGTFTSTFLFCLLVLRQVRGSDNGFEADRFIPQVSMLVAMALAICSLGVLIYFIHHVAASIQTSNVIAAVGQDLLAAIRDLYPEQIGEPRDDEGPPSDTTLAEQLPGDHDEAAAVQASAGGYIRRVVASDLLTTATDADLVVKVERRPGDFVAAGDVLLLAWPRSRVNDDAADRLRATVVIGDQRSPAQDIRYPLGQLTEVACLALSSGVNDLFTAVLCVDRLGEGLALLAARFLPSAYRADEAGRLRVVTAPFDLHSLMETALDPIRQNAANQPLVLAAMLDGLARIVARCCRPEDLAAALAYRSLIQKRAVEIGGPLEPANGRERVAVQ